MGIRLETVLPNRHFLIRLAVYRFSAGFLAAIAFSIHLSQPAAGSPLRWLGIAAFWLALFLAYFFGGLRALCYLFRMVEFYENGISTDSFDILLEQIQLVRWVQKPFRLLGIFPLFQARDHLVCFYRENQKKKCVRISGLYFASLRETFDQAYEFSIPWEYRPYRIRYRKKKAKPASAAPQPQTFLGPAVPPTVPKKLDLMIPSGDAPEQPEPAKPPDPP